MRIDTIMRRRQTLSFEVFPPKPSMDEDLSGITRTLSALREASPDFVSVTYGAGGGNTMRALDIARIVISLGMSPLSHLTAVGATREDTEKVISSLHDLGVENVLALRGDIPAGHDPNEKDFWRDFKSGADITRFVSEWNGGASFCVGGGAYPEGHQDSTSQETDIEFMRQKVDHGASFFITQLFFDDDAFKRFADRARAAGVTAPLIPGVMPVLSSAQIERIVEISGCSVPRGLAELLDKYADDDASMRDAGTDFAAAQIRSLWAEGWGVHLYTMNRPKSALEIMRRCGFIS